MDVTEAIRRDLVPQINSQVESEDRDQERQRLEAEHGQVWDTEELGRDFEVCCFMAPFVVVRRKKDGVEGSLTFQHHPRFYFCFEPK